MRAYNALSPTSEKVGRLNGGERGIRTPDSLSAITVFKTAGFNRSPISPLVKRSGVSPVYSSKLAATEEP